MNPVEVRDKLRSIERRRVDLLDEKASVRNRCSHENAILKGPLHYECMACEKTWEELPTNLEFFVVKSWKETMRRSVGS